LDKGVGVTRGKKIHRRHFLHVTPPSQCSKKERLKAEGGEGEELKIGILSARYFFNQKRTTKECRVDKQTTTDDSQPTKKWGEKKEEKD